MGSAESTCWTDPERLGVDGNLPPPGALTHGCIYKQHRFPLPKGGKHELLSTVCAAGSVPDPLKPEKTDHFLTAGVRTKFDGAPAVAKFGRPAANIVLVVDVSGSMSAHLPGDGGHRAGDRLLSKLAAVKRVICGEGGLLSTLRDGDKVALVTFNNDTKVIQDLAPPSALVKDRVAAMLGRQEPVGGTDLTHAVTVALRVMAHELRRAQQRRPRTPGGTAPAPTPLPGAGSTTAPSPPLGAADNGIAVEMTDIVPTDDAEGVAPPEGAAGTGPLPRTDTLYCRGLVDDHPENRIVVITDEYLGSKEDHMSAIRLAAGEAVRRGVHTTFIGLGTNIPPPTGDLIASFKGCTSFAAHSTAELQQYLVDDFAHTAFPVAYDLTVEVATQLPAAVEALGHAESASRVIQRQTVFPASGDAEDEVQCSLGLLRLAAPLPPGTAIDYVTSYLDRRGERHVCPAVYVVPPTSDTPPDWFRKTVALSRLATVVRVFLRDEHAGTAAAEPAITEATGIIAVPEDLRAKETVSYTRGDLEKWVGELGVLADDARGRAVVVDVGGGEGDGSQEDAPADDGASHASLQMSNPDEDLAETNTTTGLVHEPTHTTAHGRYAMLRTSMNSSDVAGAAVGESCHIDPTAGIASAAALEGMKIAAVAPAEPPATTVPQSAISGNYRRVLAKFADPYLAEEVAAANDATLHKWYQYLKGVTELIKEEDVAARAEAVLTPDRLRAGASPDSVFDLLNGGDGGYGGRLRENHRRAVDRAFSNKLYGFLLATVREVVDAHTEWFTREHGVCEAVLQAVRASFPYLSDDDAAWDAWQGRWGALVDATLRTSLHARAFAVARGQYEAAAGAVGAAGLDPDALTTAVIAAITAASPPLQEQPPAEGTANRLRELKAFVARWIVPPLLSHVGRCKWSYEQGVPVAATEATTQEIAAPQCPTQ